MAGYLAGYLAGSLAGLLNVFLMLSSFERQILPAICLFKHQPSSVSFRLLRAIKEKTGRRQWQNPIATDVCVTMPTGGRRKLGYIDLKRVFAINDQRT